MSMYSFAANSRHSTSPSQRNAVALLVHKVALCMQGSKIQGFVSRVHHLLRTGVLVVRRNVSARCSSCCRRGGCSCRLTASTALVTEA